MGTLIGLIFLIWFSTIYIWFLALLFTVLTGFIHAYVDKKTQVSKDVLMENNPFTIFALCFAAVIYFSAPMTDNGAYCAKVETQLYEKEVFEGINRDGSYDISKEFYSIPGRAGCSSTTTNIYLLGISLLLSLVFFIKTLILYGSYILGKRSP